MTARDVLAEIEQRTESALRPGTSVYRALDKTVIDNRTLVAALRAVLDEMHAAERRKPMAPEMAWCSVAVLRDLITDALNGVTAAGSDRSRP